MIRRCLSSLNLGTDELLQLEKICVGNFSCTHLYATSFVSLIRKKPLTIDFLSENLDFMCYGSFW